MHAVYKMLILGLVALVFLLSKLGITQIILLFCVSGEDENEDALKSVKISEFHAFLHALAQIKRFEQMLPFKLTNCTVRTFLVP